MWGLYWVAMADQWKDLNNKKNNNNNNNKKNNNNTNNKRNNNNNNQLVRMQLNLAHYYAVHSIVAEVPIFITYNIIIP